MAGQILYRTATLDTVEGRTIYGRAVPYETPTAISEFDYETNKVVTYREKFVNGSFARSIAERGHKVKLLTQHDQRKLAVGKAVELREEPDGLYGSFEVAATRDGDELLELVRTGVVDSFSIGFRPVRDDRRGDLVTRIEARLNEVSAVNFGAYEDATISGVRSRLIIPRAAAQAWLETLDW